MVTICKSCVSAMLALLLELGPGVVLAVFGSILSMSVYCDFGSKCVIIPRGDTSG